MSAATLIPPGAWAADIVVPAQSTEYEFPTDWGLTYKYDDDASRVRKHMVVATGLAKGSNNMEDFGKNMKKEMVDFVSYYRRFPKVAGKPSFSTLYTSINVLALPMVTSTPCPKSAASAYIKNTPKLTNRFDVVVKQKDTTCVSLFVWW